MFTSGTTGNPKGVMLSHRNLLANVAGTPDTSNLTLTSGISTRFKLEPSDVHISYLPLAHSFERVVMNCVHVYGACAGFYRGDVTKVSSDHSLEIFICLAVS